LYEAGVWKEDDRNTYTYGSDGRLLKMVNTDVSTPTKVGLANFTYGDKGKLATVTVILKKSGVVAKEARLVWQWSEAGRLDRQTVFARKSGEWVEVARRAITYDEASRPSAQTYHQRKTADDPWRQTARNTWKFDTAGKLKSFESFQADKYDELKPYSRNIYTWVDSTHIGQHVSEIMIDGAFKFISKTTTTFTSAGTSHTYDRWVDDPTDVFLSAPRDLYGRFLVQPGL